MIDGASIATRPRSVGRHLDRDERRRKDRCTVARVIQRGSSAKRARFHKGPVPRRAIKRTAPASESGSHYHGRAC
jgi:hypothetical protein